MPSPHQVLGVDRDADEGEIERAYRQRVKETHPDHGGSSREFQRVREAYETLRADGAVEATGSVDAWHPERVQYPTPSSSGDSPVAEPATTAAEVTYLNYEVLDDHDWSLDDEDLFTKAADADLEPADYGEFDVEGGETLLEAAEESGYAWPFACRGGACANCAVAVIEGALSQPVDHILTDDLTEQGFQLSCMGEPLTDELQVVYNVKHLPDLDELRLPPHPFTRTYASD